MVPYKELCFGPQIRAGGVLKREAYVIKAITKVASAMRIMGVVARVDGMLTLAFEASRIIDVVAVRRHF